MPHLYSIEIILDTFRKLIHIQEVLQKAREFMCLVYYLEDESKDLSSFLWLR